MDNAGVMVLATALYLGRDIQLYSQAPAATKDTNELSITRIDGRGETADLQPLSVFFHSRHYQTLTPPTPPTNQ